MVSIMLSLFPEDTKQPKSLEDTKRDLEKFIDSTINEVSSEKIKLRKLQWETIVIA